MQRVRPGDPVAVLHPESGQHVVPKANELYEDDDALVSAYPWLFADAYDVADPGTLDQRQFNQDVEDATAEPGSRRRRGRRAATEDAAPVEAEDAETDDVDTDE